jgi:hypothetical protein
MNNICRVLIKHTEKAQGITFVLNGVLRSSLSSTHFQFVSRLSSENILLLLLLFCFFSIHDEEEIFIGGGGAFVGFFYI